MSPDSAGVQLRGAGHGQHGGVGEVRDGAAEAALARPAAQRADPLLLRHDRAAGET